MGEDPNRIDRLDAKVNRLVDTVDKRTQDRVDTDTRLDGKIDSMIDGFHEQRERRAADSERTARLETHVEHLVTGQERMEGKIDQLLTTKKNGGNKRFTLFGGGALAALGGAVGGVVAWLK